MTPLSDLRLPDVALEWHEAVAVVAALCDKLQNEGAMTAPAIDAVAISTDGDVVVVGTAEKSGSVTRGVAHILAALLDSTACPAELRQLLNHDSADPPEHESLAAFTRELSFFERPVREDILRALGSRAVDRVAEARAVAELERLTERARQQHVETGEPSGKPSPDPIVDDEHEGRWGRPAVVPMLVAGAVGLGLVLAVATLFTTAEAPSPSSPAPTAAPGVDQRDRVLPEAAASAPASAPASSSSPPRTGAPVTQSRVATAPVPQVAASTSPAGVSRREVPGRQIDVRVTELGGAPLPATIDNRRPPNVGGGRIYNLGDPGVSPAVLVRPQLPAELPPDLPPEDVGTLELIVSEHGGVEHVRLISPSNRYQERMLVAAAKAWQFQPATREGRAVRFRARIRVTL